MRISQNSREPLFSIFFFFLFIFLCLERRVENEILMDLATLPRSVRFLTTLKTFILRKLSLNVLGENKDSVPFKKKKKELRTREKIKRPELYFDGKTYQFTGLTAVKRAFFF